MFSWDDISKRWQLIIMLQSGFIIEYTLRVNASVAVVEMKDEFGWTEDQHGLFLSAFYWGYTLGQIPSALIVPHTGSKNLFATSIFLASMLTILLPLAANISFSTALVMRALTGLAESAAFPATFHMYPKWVPVEEQTSMVTCVMSGLYLGEIICFLLSGYFVVSTFSIGGIDIGGWVSVFWVFGVLGLLWTPLWLHTVYETPHEHPTISRQELAILDNDHQYKVNRMYHHNFENADALVDGDGQDEWGGDVRMTNRENMHDKQHLLSTYCEDVDKAPPAASTTPSDQQQTHHKSLSPEDIVTGTPWLAFFTHPSSVTLLVAYWTQNWIGYLILSELPTFFTEELGFRLKEAGVASMAPYIAQYVSTLAFGWGFQWLQRHRGWSTRAVRQWAQHICFGGSSLCLVACGFVRDVPLAMVLMVLALALYGSCQSGLACSFLDVSPNYSSTLNTIANFFGALSGVASPLVVSGLTDVYQGVVGWRYVFILTALQCVFSSMLWYFFQTSDVVPQLNDPKV